MGSGKINYIFTCLFTVLILLKIIQVNEDINKIHKQLDFYVTREEYFEIFNSLIDEKLKQDYNLIPSSTSPKNYKPTNIEEVSEK